MRTKIVVTAAALGAALVVWLARTERNISSPEAVELKDRGHASQAQVGGGTSATKSIPNSSEPAAPRVRQIKIDELATALGSQDDAVQTNAIENLFAELVKQDPEAARSFVETVDNPEQRARLIQVLARGLASTDHDGALVWAAGLKDENEREAAISMVLTAISLTDPAEAVRRRQRLEMSPDDPVLENLAQRWAEKDLAAAIQWADSLAPGEQRDRINARTAYVQAQTSPEIAAQAIVDRMSPGPTREEALISVLHQWAQRDVMAAERWVEEQPSGPLKVRAAAEVAAISRTKTGAAPD